MLDHKKKAASAARPLFIPLNTQYFEAFANGDKVSELRVYGKRWNENTCRVGREVVLSKGYGKQNRIRAEIYQFSKVEATALNEAHQAAILRLYGSLDRPIAEIRLCGLEWITRNT